MIKDILTGLLALIVTAMVLTAMILPLYLTGEHNAQKVQHLTAVCVEHGHAGAVDTGKGTVCIG
jgi:hypothetical protein